VVVFHHLGEENEESLLLSLSAPNVYKLPHLQKQEGLLDCKTGRKIK
jgi:hypothetical protein